MAKKVKMSKAQEKALLAKMGAKAKHAPKGSGKGPRGKKIKVSLSPTQQSQRQKFLAYDAVKIEDVIYKARTKAIAEWLRSSAVRPTLRQDWYWIYSDKRAPKKVEEFLYSRGFRRHSSKPAYIFGQASSRMRGVADSEKKYGGESRF